MKSDVGSKMNKYHKEIERREKWKKREYSAAYVKQENEGRDT